MSASIPARPRILRSAPPPVRRVSEPPAVVLPETARETPSATHFIWRDWWSFLSVMVIASPWALVGLLVGSRFLPVEWIRGSLEPAARPYFVGLGIGLSMLGGLGLYFRLKRLRRFFEEGVELTGVIESMAFIRDRGQVFFSFHFQHRQYQSSMALHQTRATRSLRVGQEVRVLIDPTNPIRAILPAVFD